MKFLSPYAVLMLAAALTSCGGEADGGKESRVANGDAPSSEPKAAQPAVAVVKEGGSGLIPDAKGIVPFDREKLEAARSTDTRLCAIDKINGSSERELSLKARSQVRLDGWVLDAKRRSPERFALLLLSESGSYALGGNAGKVRRDVARVHKSPSAGLSGYSLEFSLADVLPGDYTLALLQDTDGNVTLCTTRKKLRVGI